MTAALDLAPWRALGAAVARGALRADPAAAGQPVTAAEIDGVLAHLDLDDDARAAEQLECAGVAGASEHVAAAREAVCTGYVEAMRG